MRIILSFALLTLLSANTYAQTPQISRIDVIEYGIYRAEATKRTDTPGTAGGYVVSVTNITNIQVTRTVPARLGVKFGFRYNVVGMPNGVTVPVTIVDKFPEQGLRKPGSTETFYQEKYGVTRTIGKASPITALIAIGKLSPASGPLRFGIRAAS